MKKMDSTSSGHTVTGNIFEAIGFSASEASALAVKSDILSAIIEHVRKQGFTQRQLAELLDEHQPSVSNLMRGRVGQVSIEKLLRYADRLELQTQVVVQPRSARRRITTGQGPKARKVAGSASASA